MTRDNLREGSQTTVVLTPKERAESVAKKWDVSRPEPNKGQWEQMS